MNVNAALLPWHMLTPAERRELYEKPCQYCGRKYVNATKRVEHEMFKCAKRPEANRSE